MRYNQYSYIPRTVDEAEEELKEVGFHLKKELSNKENLAAFIKQIYFHHPDTDYIFEMILADNETNLASFWQSSRDLTEQVFYTVALQILDFIPYVDFKDTQAFIKEIHFPISFDPQHFLLNLYQLLATRTKKGMILIDSLVSQGLLPMDNAYHYFNGKSLATFDTNDLIREIVYVEAPIDTDEDGQLDLIKVNIIRPKSKSLLPTIMTASPYHQGTNDKAADHRLHSMQARLGRKKARQIMVSEKSLPLLTKPKAQLASGPARETFTFIDSYSLNDYLLARGFANIYVSGIGTKDSNGFMTTGDYAQIESFKAVIDWLNGRALAYSSRQRKQYVLADWASGLVATTGKSYLGTMSTGLATKGLEELKVIIAESAISSWYDYYRENGLVCSPGGYPGEDLDVLTELTYSRHLAAGDYLKNNQHYQKMLAEQTSLMDRDSGDYNQFWHDRNYLPHAANIKAHVVYTHGLQDWNVKPSQVFQILKALPEQVQKHAFLHQGEHVYMHNWQSIDFRESMNALLSAELLGHSNQFTLPNLIWQDNTQPQCWQNLENFGSSYRKSFSLGQEEQLIANHYSTADFARYSKNFNDFKEDLFHKKANEIVIDIAIAEDFLINGQIQVNLRVKSSSDRGILSAQVLDYGKKKRFSDRPEILALNSIDNGQNFAREALRELPYKESPYRVISKGFLNLQNRTDLLSIEEVVPGEWMTLRWKLQPSLYRLKKGDKIRVLLYTTDFEHTIRDNSPYMLTLDLAQSSLQIPIG